jgi:uncharacterized membrane protein
VPDCRGKSSAFISPLFVLVGAVLSPDKGRPYLIAALALLLAGTIALFLAAETGEAAAELADRTPEINATLQLHEQLASTTRILLSVFSGLLVVVFALPHFRVQPLTRFHSTTLPLIFRALYSTGILALVDTAHQGGKLVHQFGVHAMIPAEDPGQSQLTASPGE